MPPYKPFVERFWQSDTAAFVLEAMKDRARLLPGRRAELKLPRRRKLAAVWAPDCSYGRLHEPPPGNEEFQWVWQLWTPVDAARDRHRHTHVAPEHSGWRGLHGGEGEALALLTGTEAPDRLAEGKLLAERFAR